MSEQGRPLSQVTVSFDMLVYRFGPLVAALLMPDLVAVTTRDDLPAGPYESCTEEYQQACALAVEAGADLRYRPLTSRWRSNHGNDGPLVIWPRKPGSRNPAAPGQVVTRVSLATIDAERSTLKFTGPSPLAFQDNRPLAVAAECGHSTCDYSWTVPPEFVRGHYWAWADPDDDRQFWPLADGAKAPPETDPVLTISQTAQYLGITVKTLYNWRADPSRNQPTATSVDGVWVYRKSHLDEWLRVG